MTQRTQENIDKVLAVMACYAAGETKTCLKEKSVLSTARFDAALAALVDAGKVEACEVIRANRQKYPGYRPVAHKANDSHSVHSVNNTRDDLPD